MSSTAQRRSALQASREVRSSFQSEIAQAQETEAELERQLQELDAALSRLKQMDGGRTSSLYFSDLTSRSDSLDGMGSIGQDIADDSEEKTLRKKPKKHTGEQRDGGFDEVLEHQAHNTRPLSTRTRTKSDTDVNVHVLPLDVLKTQFSMSPSTSITDENICEENSDTASHSAIEKCQGGVHMSTSTQDSGYPDDEFPVSPDLSNKLTQPSLSIINTSSFDTSCTTSLDTSNTCASPLDSSDMSQFDTITSCECNEQEGRKRAVRQRDNEAAGDEDKRVVYSKLNEVRAQKRGERKGCVDKELISWEEEDSDTDLEEPADLPQQFFVPPMAHSRRGSTCSTGSQSKRPVVVTDI